MRIEILDEPELEFGGGQRHVDPRFGISAYGPADLGDKDAPTKIRLGLVGSREQIDGIRRWIERCRRLIAVEDKRHPHLFPAFPGCTPSTGLCTTLYLAASKCRQLPDEALRRIGNLRGELAIQAAVALYMDELRALAEDGQVNTILVAWPEAIHSILGTRPAGRQRSSRRTGHPLPKANFHDLLKARALPLGIPLQIIQRSTWDEYAPPPLKRSPQDEACRAWNLHIAMYYKASGIPWRMRRETRVPHSCYMGLSFYRPAASDDLIKAVGHIIDGRREGLIVHGGTAYIRDKDGQPHMPAADARELMMTALTEYQREQHSPPARLAIHKSSCFTDEETEGFTAAANERDIPALDMVWLERSENTMIFRPGTAPPLRGTFMTLCPSEHLIYTTGSTDFYSAYPGSYTPRPLGLRSAQMTVSPRALGIEMLTLSKMNWNHSRLDGKLPVTLQSADQAAQILRFCDPDQDLGSRYAQYM